jgi:hypothetical protein
MCCQGVCRATYNDPQNCGGCGVVCSGSTPFCNNGQCSAPPACTLPPPAECNLAGTHCCGTFCCTKDQMCCNVASNLVTKNPQCVAPVNGTCPLGSPGTP